MKKKKRRARMKHRSQRDLYLEPMHRRLIGRVLDLATDFIEKGREMGEIKSVVDIGCAEGMYLGLLPQAEVKVGIDISLLKLRIGRKKRRDVLFVLSDAEFMPFRSYTFDLALCIEVLEHTRNPENVVNELYRILKLHGEAIFSVPLGNDGDPTHIHVFYPMKLRKLLKRCGFVVEYGSTRDSAKTRLRILLREHIKKLAPKFIRNILPKFLPNVVSKAYFPFILMVCRK